MRKRFLILVFPIIALFLMGAMIGFYNVFEYNTSTRVASITVGDTVFSFSHADGLKYIVGGETKLQINSTSNVDTDSTDDVKLTGDQTIAGNKTFTDGINAEAVTIGSTDYNPAREISSLDLTADTVLTEAQINANMNFTNQGDDGEQDITYPALSYVIGVRILEEETQIIEVNPPSGEIQYLNNTPLDADDCIDSPGTGLGVLIGIRKQDSSGTWHWYWYTSTGLWVDTGASD